MPESTGETPESATPESATPEGQEPEAPDSGEEPYDKDRAMKLINELRRFERGEALPEKVRSELDSLRQKVKEHEDAQKSEGEKASERIADLEREKSTYEQTIQELRVRGAFVAKAAEAGAKYPEKAFRLLDLSKVEFDSDGEPSNIPALLDALKADVPELFQATRGSGGGGARQTPSTAPDMDRLLRTAVGKD